jgi:predicted RNase H-like HicB family nuclease
MSALGEQRITSTNGYTVVLEHGPTSWGAYVPDLPVCVAVADTREQVERDIAQAIAMHLEGLREDGLPIPEPRTPATN